MYSVQIATSDGTLTRIELSIKYFAKGDISLYRNTDISAMVLGVDWEWDGDYGINILTGAEPTGTVITIRRTTNKDRAYNIYDGGAAFSRDSLDENFLQMIYLAQEFTEGNGLDGLYRALDMHGYRIINLGDAIEPGDAVNKKQLDVVDARVDAIEGSFVTDTVSYPWYFVTTTTTDVLTPPLAFTKAALYLNGLAQTPDYSYVVVSNSILLADTVPAGTMVFARLGEDVEAGGAYASAAQFSAFADETDARLDLIEPTLAGKASAGANADITSLSGLTTPLSVPQGGHGGTTTAQARTNLGLGNSATRDVGTVAGQVAAGNDSRLVGALQAANNLSDLTSASAARTSLGLGNSAMLNTGTTAGTVLAGDAIGRFLGVTRYLANATWTPNAATQTIIVEAVGGGGGGGGTPVTGAMTVAAGAGGNSGTYGKAVIAAAQFGTSQAVVIGTGGAGIAGAAGGNGTQTSLGALMSCPGGNGGGTTGAITAVSGGTFVFPSARTQAVLTSGVPVASNQSRDGGQGLATLTAIRGGAGGDSTLGAGGSGVVNAVGTTALFFGGGGGGAAAPVNTAAARAGGAGAGGMLLIYEYS